MDIILSQRFLPERGGSVQWFVNLFGESIKPITVICHDYQAAPSSPFKYSKFCRADILLADWGILSFQSIRKYWKMFKLLRNNLDLNKTNHVHCSKIIPEGLAAVAVKLTTSKKIKVICFAHGEEFKAYSSSRELKLLYQLIIKQVDLVIANSEFTEKSLLQLSVPKKIAIHHPCINLKDLTVSHSRQDLRAKYNFTETDLILLTVGRLTKRKNQAGVIKALADTFSDNNIKYVMLGSGEDEAELRGLIRKYNLTERVQIYPSLDDQEKAEFYHLSDIFVMPSIDTGYDLEGFGMVYLEAAACGLPVICGSSGGEREAVLPDTSALCVSNQEELVQALKKLINYPEIRKKLAINGVDFAKKFDSQVSLQEYRELLTRSFVE